MKYTLIFLSVFFLAFTTGCKKDEVTREEQAKIDDDLILAYAEKNNLVLVSGPEGLYSIIEKPGTGTAHPDETSIIKVHYRGIFLEDEKEFDTSYGKAPFKFQLNGGVIRGWELGVALMTKGEKRKLFIPSGLAYGPNGRSSIPENAILIFDIELINF